MLCGAASLSAQEYVPYSQRGEASHEQEVKKEEKQRRKAEKKKAKAERKAAAKAAREAEKPYSQNKKESYEPYLDTKKKEAAGAEKEKSTEEKLSEIPYSQRQKYKEKLEANPDQKIKTEETLEERRKRKKEARKKRKALKKQGVIVDKNTAETPDFVIEEIEKEEVIPASDRYDCNIEYQIDKETRKTTRFVKNNGVLDDSLSFIIFESARRFSLVTNYQTLSGHQIKNGDKLVIYLESDTTIELSCTRDYPNRVGSMTSGLFAMKASDVEILSKGRLKHIRLYIGDAYIETKSRRNFISRQLECLKYW